MSKSSDGRLLKRLVMASSVLWVVAIGWTQFSPLLTSTPTYSSSYQRTTDACRGKYSQRYACRSTQMLASSRASFLSWSLKIGLVFGPPILLAGFMRTRSRRHLRREEEERRQRVVARKRKLAEEALEAGGAR